MNEQTNSQENSQNDKLNDVVALNQLVGVIVDYYSFKNRLNEEDEEEKWKKSSQGDENFVVPTGIDSIIEKAFTTQLNKFTN